MEIDKKNYADYIKEITPVHNLWDSMGKAFITGGLICTLGQLIMNRVTNTWGLEAEAAGAWTSIILVFLSALCTGLNIYQKLVKFGGAGDQLSSAIRRFTVLFGMGRSGTASLWSSGNGFCLLSQTILMILS